MAYKVPIGKLREVSEEEKAQINERLKQLDAELYELQNPTPKQEEKGFVSKAVDKVKSYLFNPTDTLSKIGKTVSDIGSSALASTSNIINRPSTGGYNTFGPDIPTNRLGNLFKANTTAMAENRKKQEAELLARQKAFVPKTASDVAGRPVSQFAEQTGKFIPELATMAVLSKFGVPAPIGMGTASGLTSYGEGETGTGIAKSAAKGTAFGLGAGKTEKLVSPLLSGAKNLSPTLAKALGISAEMIGGTTASGVLGSTMGEAFPNSEQYLGNVVAGLTLGAVSSILGKMTRGISLSNSEKSVVDTLQNAPDTIKADLERKLNVKLLPQSETIYAGGADTQTGTYDPRGIGGDIITKKYPEQPSKYDMPMETMQETGTRYLPPVGTIEMSPSSIQGKKYDPSIYGDEQGIRNKFAKDIMANKEVKDIEIITEKPKKIQSIITPEEKPKELKIKKEEVTPSTKIESVPEQLKRVMNKETELKNPVLNIEPSKNQTEVLAQQKTIGQPLRIGQEVTTPDGVGTVLEIQPNRIIAELSNGKTKSYPKNVIQSNYIQQQRYNNLQDAVKKKTANEIGTLIANEPQKPPYKTGKTEKLKFVESVKTKSEIGTEKVNKELNKKDTTYEKTSSTKTFKQEMDRVNKDLLSTTKEFESLENLRNSRDTALGMALINRAKSENRISDVADLTIKLAKMLKNNGQIIEAAKLIQQLSPEGFLLSATRKIEKHNKENPSKKASLSKEEKKLLYTLIDRATRDGDIDLQLFAKAEEIVNNKIPSTAAEKIKELQFMSMLGNPFNTATTNLQSLAYVGKDLRTRYLATAYDKALSPFYGGKRSVTTPNWQKAKEAYLEGARKVIAEHGGSPTIMPADLNKEMYTDIKHGIRGYEKYINKKLSTYEGLESKNGKPNFKKLSEALNKEILYDKEFYKSIKNIDEIRAKNKDIDKLLSNKNLNQFKQKNLNRLLLEELFSKDMLKMENRRWVDTTAQLSHMRPRRLTAFNKDSKLAQISRLTRTGIRFADDPLYELGRQEFIDMKKRTKEMGDTITDAEIERLADEIGKSYAYRDMTWFTKALLETRSGLNKMFWGTKEFGVGNVLAPFVGYTGSSANKIYRYSPLYMASLAKQLFQNKKWDQYELSMALARMTTSTILRGVGLSLAYKGLAKGKSKSSEEREFYESLGLTDNSFLGGIPLMFVDPALSDMEAGINMAKEDTVLGQSREYLVNMFEQVLADTFLNNITTALRSGDPVEISNKLIKTISRQIVPNAINLLAKLVDQKARVARNPLEVIQSRIPIASRYLPEKISLFGDELKIGQTGKTMQDKFIGSIAGSTNSPKKITNEIDRLFRATKDNKVFPTIPEKFIEKNNKKYKLSNEQYTEFSKIQGEEVKKVLERTIDSSGYKSAKTDKQKVEMLHNSMIIARDTARNKFRQKLK